MQLVGIGRRSAEPARDSQRHVVRSVGAAADREYGGRMRSEPADDCSRMPDTGASRYFVEESENSDFAPATGQFVEGTSAPFKHDVTTPTTL